MPEKMAEERSQRVFSVFRFKINLRKYNFNRENTCAFCESNVCSNLFLTALILETLEGVLALSNPLSELRNF